MSAQGSKASANATAVWLTEHFPDLDWILLREGQRMQFVSKREAGAWLDAEGQIYQHQFPGDTEPRPGVPTSAPPIDVAWKAEA